MTAAYLSQRQVEQLLRPIAPGRVSRRDGLSHLEAYDVRAHLNRCFGFGRWSSDVVDSSLLFESLEEIERNGQQRNVVTVGYRVRLRLTVCAPDGTLLATYTEEATGDASNFPVTKRADAHDFAVKTAESQALKRCATNLGDQFGLSLYRNGSTDALVTGTLVGLPEPEKKPDGEQPASVDAAAPDVVPEQKPDVVAAHAMDDPSGGDMEGAVLPDLPPAPATSAQADDPVLLAQVQGELFAAAKDAGFTKVQAQRALYEQTSKALAEASVEELRMAIGAIQSKQKEKAA